MKVWIWIVRIVLGIIVVNIVSGIAYSIMAKVQERRERQEFWERMEQSRNMVNDAMNGML